MPNKAREPVQRKIVYSQPILNHPVLKERSGVRIYYYNVLYLGCNTLTRLSPYGRAVLDYYGSVIKSGTSGKAYKKLSQKLRVMLLLDMIHISGYQTQRLSPDILNRFYFDADVKAVLRKLISKLTAENPAWDELVGTSFISPEKEWIETLKKNVEFSQHIPYKILVTATMSAGKSTFVNALTGNEVAKTKNLACTGRPHYIYSKPFDDGLVSKWDRTVLIDAKRKILDGREEIKSRISYESVYFGGKLSGKRFMILDTPGVNSLEYQSHGDCAHNVLTGSSYDAVIFVINYENSGTDDEDAHLRFVKENMRKDVPVIFAVNKVDSVKSEDKPLEEVKSDIRKHLEENGFINPALFFVSSRAAYLYRRREVLKDEDDIQEFEHLFKKFSRRVSLTELNGDSDRMTGDNGEDFDYRCGIGCIEDYIDNLISKDFDKP